MLKKLIDKPIVELMILAHDTCDAIDPISGYEYNPHVDYYAVMNVGKKVITLLNLQTSTTKQVEARIVPYMYRLHQDVER